MMFSGALGSALYPAGLGRDLKVLVCGGRTFNSPVAVGAYLGAVHRDRGIATIIEGGAPGADALARAYGEFAGIPVITERADWRRHGKAAGPIRNQMMLDEHDPDLVVAFPGGSGTADMIRRARGAGVPVIQVPPTSRVS